MIVELLKELVASTLNVPFDNGRKPLQNLYDSKGPFVWLYPYTETDKTNAAKSITTSYNCIISFSVPGEVDNGTTYEQGLIEQGRLMALKLESKLLKDSRVISVTGIRREPFYNFLAENHFGINAQMIIELRQPYVKC